MLLDLESDQIEDEQSEPEQNGLKTTDMIRDKDMLDEQN